MSLYNTKMYIYEFVLIYDWQAQQKTFKSEKRASPLSPGTWECVSLVPKNLRNTPYNLRHRLVQFCFCTKTIRATIKESRLIRIHFHAI